MDPIHSRLFIHELAISEQRPGLLSTSVDLVMMSLFGSCERTEKE